MPLLAVKHLSFRAGMRQIVQDVSFSADAGQLVAFLGPNGAGKTTILRTVMGLLPAQEQVQQGGIFYNDSNISQWPISKRVAAGLVYLPQHTTLFERLTVWDNLQLVYEHHPYWQPKNMWQKIRSCFATSLHWKEFVAQTDRLLEQTGILGTKKQRAGELSGGQKRKLEVVRALLLQPKLIMLDEPFAGVDPKSIYELKELFVHLAKSGIGVLISDHHVDQLLSVAEHVYVICQGKVIASGDVAAIMQNESTQEMYLGGQFHAEMSKRLLHH